MTETNKFENLFDNNTSSENRIFTFAFDRGPENCEPHPSRLSK